MSTEKNPGHKAKHTSKRLVAHDRFSKPSLFVFVVIFAAVGGYIIWRSFAAAPPPPTIYLTPATQTLAGSTSFSVQVRENSGTTAAVNAVQANLTYDASLLTFVSIDNTGSAFPTQPQSTGGGGTITIARGTGCSTTCTSLTGDQLVATINFTTKTTTGSAAVAFATGTHLVSSSTNTDLLPSLAATGGATYSIDTTAPTVSISAPANNATIAQGNTVSVTASSSDTGSSVSKVEFYVDGALAATDTGTPYTYSWNTTGLALSSHTLQAKSYDSVGNITTSSLVTVNLTDQAAPSSPSNFRSTGNTPSTISLAWNASTDNVGVTGYKLTRNGTLIGGVLSAGTLSYTDTALAAGTSYNYSITAIDAAANTSTAATLAQATSTAVPGDTNNDGHVNLTDLSTLISNWGTTTASCDFNHDGAIDIFDLSILISHYGT